ncbi:nucleotidyltransferase family protein [soil metagenome]
MSLVALVLAGSRAGSVDPLESYAGVPHKVLIEIAGRTMIERVVTALAAVAAVERIVIAIERPELLDGLAGLQTCAKPWTTMPTQAGPSATVAAAFAAIGAPLLVTTADHALLETAWIEQFLAACPAGTDLCAALAESAAVTAAAPDSQRTWLRFAEGSYSGCNLFLLAGPPAAGVLTFWREMEQLRKHPLRMVQQLGITFALRYKAGRLGLQAAADRVGELSGGARLAFVELADGRAAIDVDKPEDLDLVRRLVSSPG